MCIPQTTEQNNKQGKQTGKSKFQIYLTWDNFLKKILKKQIKVIIYFGSKAHQNNVLGFKFCYFQMQDKPNWTKRC